MSLETIGAGIATRLETITGLQVFAPDELPDSINSFPCALILAGDTEYNAMFSGDADYNFRIIIVTTSQDKPSALNSLLDYIELTGTYSVKAAIDADKTLNNSADDCRLVNNKGVGSISWGGINYLGTEFELEVWK